MASLGLAWSAVKLWQGDYLTSVTALGFGMTFLVLTAEGIFAIRGWKTKPTFDEVGTTLRPDPLNEISVQTMIFSMTIGAGLFTLFGDRIDIWVPPTLRVSIPYMCGLLAAYGALQVVKIIRQRTLLEYLRLTPEGFAFPNTSKSPRHDWTEVKQISYRDRRLKGRRSTPAALIVTLTGGATAKLTFAGFTEAGRTVAELVYFYWQHPERRDELTDGRAIERLHSETFEP